MECPLRVSEDWTTDVRESENRALNAAYVWDQSSREHSKAMGGGFLGVTRKAKREIFGIQHLASISLGGIRQA